MNAKSYNKLLNYLYSLQVRDEKIFEESDKLPDWQIILTTYNLADELTPYVKERVSNAPSHMLFRRLN